MSHEGGKVKGIYVVDIVKGGGREGIHGNSGGGEAVMEVKDAPESKDGGRGGDGVEVEVEVEMGVEVEIGVEVEVGVEVEMGVEGEMGMTGSMQGFKSCRPADPT
ncbi:hypothetical protein FHG87_010725 [Trinorchestia longiramus]|nr:hypothetical protein FHG87_010725 [Trinorchestia longiramus]